MAKKSKNFEWGGIHPFLYHPIIFHLVPPNLKNKLVIDCGCGKGIWGFLIRTTREIGNRGKIIGIDLNKDYLTFCSKHNVYDKNIKADITKLPFKDNTVDFFDLFRRNRTSE